MIHNCTTIVCSFTQTFDMLLYFQIQKSLQTSIVMIKRFTKDTYLRYTHIIKILLQSNSTIFVIWWAMIASVLGLLCNMYLKIFCKKWTDVCRVHHHNLCGAGVMQAFVITGIFHANWRCRGGKSTVGIIAHAWTHLYNYYNEIVHVN